MSKGFHIIVATDQEGGIGQAGTLPWRLPGDLKRFKAITTQTQGPGHINAVLMGRKTWESLPAPFRPLPGRLNVVLTRQPDYLVPSGVHVFPGLERALKTLGNWSGETAIEDIFVIGGAEVYQQALAHPDLLKVYWTEVLARCHCDVFVRIPFEDFVVVGSSETFEEQGLEYCFRELVRQPVS